MLKRQVKRGLFSQPYSLVRGHMLHEQMPHTN